MTNNEVFMPSFLKPYYDTEGPFGLPMRDRQAVRLEALVKELPREQRREPRKAIIARDPAELQPGERADISWISEESIDREGDIVLAGGMDDSHFQLNPLVTMNHAYWLPPVGLSLWRAQATEGPLRGVKAKTQYQPRPDSWPEQADWPPDIAFSLVQAGLLRGKSVAFLPVQQRRPTAEEIDQNPTLARARFIIEKWILLEYACVYLPAQQNAVVESVSKALAVPDEYRKALGWETAAALPPRVGFTPLAEMERALQRRLVALDLPGRVRQAFEDGWGRLRGRV
jgi:hypothetical protein